ncbi:SusD/RagB family nutrient-binding outer membrane lipoprotein [Flavobacterium sp.]|uniref:SusD/RagB family nutrient-binding outer membrane lipoprotein n=1 Tax=Flavobacterium sp. TaxID=239 RepID=UPI0026307691|nr:SusD/RagB family nutrient-binding outer membrane lipoprotein [Flavobacterium sp.]
MKKIKFLLPIIAFSLFSCSDYLDINTSPNQPIGSQITPDLALANAESTSYREIARNMNRLGNFYMNNWGMNVNSFAATSPQEFSLSLDNSFYNTIWDNAYRSTGDYSLIIRHAAPNYENHKAIAMIMKSYHFQYLVDIYGDIPYFQAHLGVEELTPAYDDDKAIYRDLVVQIDNAIAMIDAQTATPTAKTVGSEDVINGGNMQKWKQFANTLKLRILLRQSDLAAVDAETATYLAAQFATLPTSTADYVSEDVTINPGYGDGNANQQNPFYAQMVAQGNALPLTFNNEYRFVRASKYFGDQLNATNDPRGGSIFETDAPGIQGVLQGDNAQINGGTAPIAITGLGVSVRDASGVLTGRQRLVDESEQDGFVMTLAESKLLQAEAVHRGYLAGSAQVLFDEGVTASFAQLHATVGIYLATVNGMPGLGYAVGTPDEQIQAIMYQKNIALVGGMNAMESFIEHTRTGLIDNIPLSISGVTKPNKPRRLLYPTSELVGNSANVPTQSVNDVFTTGAFWFVH